MMPINRHQLKLLDDDYLAKREALADKREALDDERKALDDEYDAKRKALGEPKQPKQKGDA